MAELIINVKVLQNTGVRVCTTLEPSTESLGNSLMMVGNWRLHLAGFNLATSLIIPAASLHATEKEEFSLSHFKYHSLYSEIEGDTWAK